MNRQFHLGVLAALFAAWAFSFNFVVPFVIDEFSTFDFAFVRHTVSGIIGLCILFMEREISRYLTLRNCLVTAWLAFIGYVGYFLAVTGAAIYCGPVIAPAFLAVVPIVLALVGNQRQRSLPWRSLMMPLILVLVGLVFVNGAAFANGSLDTGRSLWIGIPLATTAVVLWVWFAIANQAALAVRPDMPSAVWSALMLTGGGMQMLAFFPVGTAIGLFELPRLGFVWSAAGPLYLWGTSLALLATVGGVWAWNVAARNLPVALAAQLIVSETAFGVIGGLVVRARLPTIVETAGIAMLIAGVVYAVHVFHDTHARPSRVSVRAGRRGLKGLGLTP